MEFCLKAAWHLSVLHFRWDFCLQCRRRERPNLWEDGHWHYPWRLRQRRGRSSPVLQAARILGWGPCAEWLTTTKHKGRRCIQVHTDARVQEWLTWNKNLQATTPIYRNNIQWDTRYVVSLKAIWLGFYKGNINKILCAIYIFLLVLRPVLLLWGLSCIAIDNTLPSRS